MHAERPERRAMRAKLAEARARQRLVPRERGGTVLLVEDDTEMRRMVGGALRRDGHFVIEAANGDEALEWLAPGVLIGWGLSSGHVRPNFTLPLGLACRLDAGARRLTAGLG